MAAAETFARLSQHMVKGIMIHTEFADYYLFLNLPGYAACHRYHAKSESKSRHELHEYYITHYGKLIQHQAQSAVDVIPNNWFSYSRVDVSPSDIAAAVRKGLEAWVKWERDTKQLYQSAYRELMEQGEVAAACFVRNMVLDVAEELNNAERYLLNKKAVDYDIGAIMSEQDGKRHEYRTKMVGI